MTVITVLSTDPGGTAMRWDVPADPQLNNSPIPRALRIYGGTLPIAALGTGDETNVIITLSFPTQFNYLPKSITLAFLSDDATSEFGNLGSMEYHPGGSTAPGTRKAYVLQAEGQSFRSAALSEQIYRPLGTWRQWIMGNGADIIQLRIADMSMDTSAAGDVNWTADFWEYDIEQCLKWPVNTPIPQVAF